MNETTNTTATETETRRAEMIQAIREAGGRNVYVYIVNVSRSGMSRRLSFHMVYDGELVEINHLIRPDLAPDRHCIRVNGCGSNMISMTLRNFYSYNDIPERAACQYNLIHTK